MTNEKSLMTYSTGRKLFVLIGSAVALTFLVSLLVSVVVLFAAMSLRADFGTLNSNMSFMKISQLTVTVVTFLVPVVILSRMCGNKTQKFVRADRGFSVSTLMWVILVIVSIQPFMGATADWFSNWSLPSSLSGLEHALKEMEKRNIDLVNHFLDVHSVGALLVNILIVAVAPAICEEFFFRGGLQQLFYEKMNKHAAIWLAAVVFSAVHMEVSGFLPRVVLGASFGYLFVWTGSIWLPVAAHFINNLGGVVAEYLIYNHLADKNIVKFGSGDTLWASVLGLVLFGIALAILFHKRERSVVVEARSEAFN